MKRILLCLFIAFGGITAYAQKDTLFLAGSGKLYNDSLVLRWNTLNPTDFIRGFESGYVVELHERGSENSRLIERKEIRPAFPAAGMVNQNDSSGLEMLGSIYMLRNFKAPSAGAGIEELKTYQNHKNMLWGVISMMADIDPKAAEAAGLRYVFRQRRSDAAYAYRVYALSNRYISDTLTGFFYPGSPDLSRNLSETINIIEGEKNIQVSVQGNRKYSAYWLEKQVKGSNGFLRVNELPQLLPSHEFARLNFSDSVALNYVPGTYRIAASDPFGDLYFSEVFQAMGRDKTPPAVDIEFKGKAMNDSMIELSWKLLSGNSYDIYRLKLSRSELGEGPYQFVSEFTSPQGSTQNISRDGASGYFYLLEAIDTAGNATPFITYCLFLDETAPQQPTGLKARVDSNGIVLIEWEAVPDSDLDGYLVFKGNDLKHEFSGVVSRPQKENYFYDTLALNMLNRNLFYRVIAVDYHFNRSKASEVIKVLRPDTIAPVSPQIIHYEVNDSFVLLELQASSSVDVHKTYLYREHQGKAEVIDSIVFKKPVLTYTDKKLKPGSEYGYYMIALDSSGNRSHPGNMIQIRMPQTHVLFEAPQLIVTYDSVRKSAMIQWQKPGIPRAMIHLYRGSSSENMQYLRTFSADNLQYRDELLPKGNVYYEAVFANEKGIRGKMCAPVLMKKTD